MDDSEKDRINEEIEALKSRLNAVMMQNDDLNRSLVDASRRIAELSSEVDLLKKEAGSKDEDDDGDDGEAKDMSVVEPVAQRVENPQVIVPDTYAFGGSSTRNSIEWAPEMANIPQLNEFDDAPSVGNLSIKRAGKKLLLTDPDGTSGQRKWMVPLRRETSEAIELKWAQLGEGSDSDSDSDSDFPCQDEYTLEDGSDGDCGTTISLKRQAYKRGTGGQCEPDGDPEDAGSVTIPDPPEYRLSDGDGTGCKKTIQLQKKSCDDESWGDVGNAVEIDKPKTYTVELTSSAGACTKKYQLKETDCSGRKTGVGTEIEVPTPPNYSLAEAQGSTPCLKKYQLTKSECGGSASPVSGAVMIEVPGKDSISATSTGSTAGGEKAGTVTVTPCGGSATTIDIYNGKDGCTPEVSAFATGSSGGSLAGTIYVTPCGGTQIPINVYNGKDGCSPEISAATPPTSHGSAAYTITPCGSGASPITVYHGRDGESGLICGSVDIVVGIRVGTGTGGGTFLQINKVTHTFQKRSGSDCYELVPGADNWVDTNVEFRPCS